MYGPKVIFPRFPLRSYPMFNKPLVVVAVFTIVVAALRPPVLACNTPVYRYAMYNWQTAPYIVFYFHEGEIPDADQAVHKSLQTLTEQWPPQANVRIEPINVSDEKKMETLPEFVIEAWKAYDDGKKPAYVIFSPFRAHVYSGQLDTESVQKLIDSPARQKFGGLLEEGNAAVMILLTCSDQEQNKKAEEALAGLRKLADSGEIPVELELPPMGLPGRPEGEQEAADAGAPDPKKLGIAVLKVDRNDPAEEFFVRMLMAVEDDLKEYADQPMIFAGYGRGRAMEPYIGKGITAENLVDVVAFLAGACSCMVKEQNPGADLLVKWNWEKTADKMAENDPSLDYGPYGPQGYGEFPAEPAMSGAGTADDSAESTGGDNAQPQPAKSTEVALAAPPAKDPSAAEEAATTAESPASEPASAEPNEESNKPAPAVAETDRHEALSETSAPSSNPAETGSFSGRRMTTYAFGFGAIALGVIVAGLALVLRRS
jgi:hypothetical protein